MAAIAVQSTARLRSPVAIIDRKEWTRFIALAGSKMGDDGRRCLRDFDVRQNFTREDNPSRRSSDSAFPPRQEGEALEQMDVLLVLQERAVQRRNELLRVALAQHLRRHVLDHQELQ